MNIKLKALVAGLLIVTASVAGVNLAGINTVKATASEKPKAKNVIMLIGDGMSMEGVTLAREVKGSNLAMDEIASGSVITSWAGGPITDSAPGATAYSSGEKTNNKYIGTSINDTPLATIIEGAESKNKATGIIATSEITHATPADFAAHTDNRKNYNQILKNEIYGNLEVFLGGGFNTQWGYESEVTKEEFNAYYQDRVKDVKDEGYQYVTTKAEMDSATGSKLWGSFANGDLKYDYDRKADNDTVQPTLQDMTSKAIDVLNKNENGFFLMVEGSKIDWAAHANNTVGIVSDILAFDDAVKSAVDFAKKDGNTVVVVTTDHGNSGITIGSNYYNDNSGSYDKATYDNTTNKLKAAKITEERFDSLIAGKTDDEIKTLAKENYSFDLTADELKIVKGEVSTDAKKGIREIIARRCGIGYTTGGHTGEAVYLGVYAPSKVSGLEGTVDNTAVNKYMQDVLFGGEILKDYTSKTFQDGQAKLSAIPDCTITIDKTIKYAPKVTITRLGNTIELELYTNKYTINGESKRLKTVMPLIKDKFYVNQELVDIVSGLKQRGTV